MKDHGVKDESRIMRIQTIMISVLLSIISCPAIAGWQLAKPEATIPREPFFQAGVQRKTSFIPATYSSRAFPNQYAHLGQSAPLYAMSISGSLKENLERIMGRYRWRVIWKAPYDYNFDGRITGSSLPSVVEKLLQPFPLQGIMYMSNHTIAIVPRMKV
jgi:hypothetical protein